MHIRDKNRIKDKKQRAEYVESLYKKYEGDNPNYYSYYVYMNLNVFRLTMGKLTFNDAENTEPVINNVRGDVQLANGADLGNTKIMINKRSNFDFDVYIMTFGGSGYNLYHATTSNLQSNGFTQLPAITLPFDFGESYTLLDFNFINKSPLILLYSLL